MRNRHHTEIELHGITTSIPNLVLTRDKMIQLYREMVIIRSMEKFLDEEYDGTKIRGFCHLIIGQEALYAVLRDILGDDCIIASYRCHGAAYAAGMSLKEIICENLGTRDGCSRGKGGSMHLYSEKMFGGHGIVGAQVPLGAGIAFAQKYQSAKENKKDGQTKSVEESRQKFLNCMSKNVCFCIFGDGASNQGQVHETYNMAKIYNLPIVFIVENNGYGMYTPLENVTVDDNLFKRGYGIPGIRVCDTKIADVKRVLEFAREYVKKNGPIITQIDTFRKCGHCTEDKSLFYMNNEEIKENDELDCLFTLKNELRNLVSEEELKMIEEEARDKITDVVNQIDRSNTPEAKDAFTDLFFEHKDK